MKTVFSFCNFFKPMLFQRSNLFFFLLTSSAVNAQNNSIFYGGNGGGSNSSCLSLPVILPIEFLNFETSCEGDQIILSWSTLSETNSKKFVVETSFDGINWTLAGTLEAANNSSQIRNYSFLVRPTSLTNYIKLSLVDYDGVQTLLKLASAENCYLASTSIYPNPSEGNLLVTFGQKILNGNLFIYDAVGRRVGEIEIKGAENMQLDFSDFAPGIYLITIEQGSTLISSNHWIKI